MNKHQFIGNITKDAEVRQFEGGRSVINFSCAVNERWKDKNGQKQEKTYFFKCALWREHTTIAPYLTKGTKVYIEGRPEAEVYQNKDGNWVGNIKVTVDEIELLGGGKKNGQESSAGSSETFSNETLVPTPDDSDLPF